MSILVERITRTVQRLGLEADFRSAAAVTKLQPSTAVVVGSALYYGSWMKEAMAFVRHNQAVLAERPVWRFSSGPPGVGVNDNEPQPKELGAQVPDGMHLSIGCGRAKNIVDRCSTS